MRKKLLAGMLALALCSTNMPLQTIFAEEFTSGNPDVVSEEETPEIFTNEEQEAVGETDEELSVFSSEEVPEFNDAPDEAMAAAENEQAGEIDLADNEEITNSHVAGKQEIELWLMERKFQRKTASTFILIK